jgi:hypothetical protein
MEKLVEITGNEDIRWDTSNQLLSFTDLLQMGLRHLELDVHWVFQTLVMAHCGGVSIDQIDEKIAEINEKLAEKTDKQIRWDSESIGCFPSGSMIYSKDQRSLDEALSEINDWFNLRSTYQQATFPQELQAEALPFLMLMLDVTGDDGDWGTADAMHDIFDKYFEGQYYTPKHLEEEDGGVMPSIQEMSDRGFKFMVTSSKQLSDSMSDFFFLRSTVCDWTEVSVENLNPFPECTYEHGGSTLASGNGTFIRLVSSEIQYGPLNENGDLGNDYPFLDEEAMEKATACDTSMLAGDNMVPSRSKAYIWSWREGEPSFLFDENENEENSKQHWTLLDASDGRWMTLEEGDAQSLATVDSVLCAKKDESSPFGSFSLLSLPSSSSYSSAEQLCQEEGFDGVGVPPTSKYNHQFVEEMKTNGFSKAFIGLTFN